MDTQASFSFDGWYWQNSQELRFSTNSDGPLRAQTEATLTYNAPEKRYYVQGFVKNMENKLLVTAVGGGANGTLQVSDPRTYGVRAGLKF